MSGSLSFLEKEVKLLSSKVIAILCDCPELASLLVDFWPPKVLTATGSTFVFATKYLTIESVLAQKRDFQLPMVVYKINTGVGAQ